MFFKEQHKNRRIASASQCAFLVDGESYFRAIADACEAAEKAIYIVGWDIDSRIRLRRDSDAEQETLGKFIDRLARQKPKLHIYILEWDFAMLYSLERETWPLLSFGWMTHKRVHFELDDNHPVGASHHQKIVVIDDQVAFVGGFDLACCRWDTSSHRPDEPKRLDSGVSYGPFHDVQMMVEGQAAAELGTLVRRRWERTTGDLLSDVVSADSDPWPKQVDPDLNDASLAILRTEPEHDGAPEIREIEQFYLDAIGQAETSIYIENQYLTSHTIGKALEQTLKKQHGPEVLIVLPRECSGWLEKETMGALRQRLLQGLHNADHHKRLKICYPERNGLGAEIINVHSKLMTVDDKLLTIGSANLSNRSMGFDTECNLALSADDQQHLSEAITGFRNRLVAEHLGVKPQQIGDLLKENNSLLDTVSALNEGERSLRELPVEKNSSFAEQLSADEIIDPERPIDIERLLDFFDYGTGSGKEETRLKHQTRRFVLLIGTALILAALWRWSPLNQWLNIDALLAAADSLRESPAIFPIILALYVIGSCLMFPITVMILATALSFGPWTGFALAFSGSLLGGLASYLIGRWIGRDAVRKLAGKKLNRLSRKIATRGWLAIAVVRMVPIAPFTIVNLVAGSTHISARSFLIGTGVGMGPGIMAIMLFEGGLEQALRNPGWGSLLLAVVALCAAAAILLLGKSWLTSKKERHEQ